MKKKGKKIPGRAREKTIHQRIKKDLKIFRKIKKVSW